MDTQDLEFFVNAKKIMECKINNINSFLQFERVGKWTLIKDAVDFLTWKECVDKTHEVLPQSYPCFLCEYIDSEGDKAIEFLYYWQIQTMFEICARLDGFQPLVGNEMPQSEIVKEENKEVVGKYPLWAKYKARDYDNTLWVYAIKPRVPKDSHTKQWISDEGECDEIFDESRDGLCENWRETCEEIHFDNVEE